MCPLKLVWFTNRSEKEEFLAHQVLLSQHSKFIYLSILQAAGSKLQSQHLVWSDKPCNMTQRDKKTLRGRLSSQLLYHHLHCACHKHKAGERRGVLKSLYILYTKFVAILTLITAQCKLVANIMMEKMGYSV